MELLKTITSLIPFLEPYPTWVKAVVSIWLVGAAVVIALLVLVPKQQAPAEKHTEVVWQEPPVSSARSLTIQGHIRDATTKLGLKGVTVRIVSPADVAPEETDSNGYFVTQLPLSAKQTRAMLKLQASINGYDDWTLTKLVAEDEVLGEIDLHRTKPAQKKTAIEEKSVNDKEAKTNITSVNQSGGITAQTVNIGPQPRHLDTGTASNLESLLSKDKKITITAVLGDGEAFQFASEIVNYLKSRGYTVDGVNQSVYSQPVMGQIVQPTAAGFDIIIGTKQ